VISISETEQFADQLMRERYNEPIRSRQIKVVIAAIVAKVNEEFARSKNIEAGKTSYNKRVK
jgi:hypothetical protein